MELDTRLPTRHRQRLHYWLTAEGSPDDTLGLCGAHGLLCATVCAPEPVSPLHLASAVFGESGESYFQALPDREEGLGLLMALYHEVMNDAFEESLSLPPDCQVLEPAERNLVPGAPLREWSDGFERGYRLVSAKWDKYCSQEMEDELRDYLRSLMYFGPSERVAALRQETADDHDTTVEAFSEEVVQLIPTVLKSYARMGLAIFDAIFEAETAFERDDALDAMPPPPKQPVRREKIGRNEPCPCGSGRKYKKCCRSPANS